MPFRMAAALVAVIAATGCATTSQGTRLPSPPALSTPSPGDASTPTPSDSGTPAPDTTPTPTSNSAVCRDPHEHVYHPDRLHLVSACMTVTGTIEVIRNEADGDYHILLRLDNGYGNLTNNVNISSQRGDLVLEPVCEIRVTQRDAVSSCAGVAPSVPRPAIGSHVSVTGAYVLDSMHGWMELHPVWDIHTA